MSEYGIQFADWCEFPPETMVGETVFDGEGNAIGWILNATVGAGTCHAVIDKDYYKGINGVCEGLYCSKCKEPLSRRFKHCPWCGRKIKED